MTKLDKGKLHPDLIQELKGELFGGWKPGWRDMRKAVRWSKVNDMHVGDFSSVRAGALDYLKGLYRVQLEAEVEKWKAEANRLYGVGQDIEDDRVALQQQVKQLRELFDGASSRIRAGKSKRLLFLCSHCHKETPLLLDGLLADANAPDAGAKV